MSYERTGGKRVNAQQGISQSIEAELAARRKTKTDLAETLGISRRNLYQRLANHVSWSVNDLEEVSNFLGMSYWQLMDSAEQRINQQKMPSVPAEGDETERK